MQLMMLEFNEDTNDLHEARSYRYSSSIGSHTVVVVVVVVVVVPLLLVLVVVISTHQ